MKHFTFREGDNIKRSPSLRISEYPKWAVYDVQPGNQTYLIVRDNGERIYKKRLTFKSAKHYRKL